VVRHFNNRVQTFGVTFEEDRFDESKYQRLMVEYLLVNHSEIAATNRAIRENFRTGGLARRKTLASHGAGPAVPFIEACAGQFHQGRAHR